MWLVAEKRKQSHRNACNRAGNFNFIISISDTVNVHHRFSFPSKCHHDNPHNCHPYECPPCNQLCLLPNDTTNCDHLCQVKCHDSVKVSFIDKNFKPAGPWEKQVERVRSTPTDFRCRTKLLIFGQRLTVTDRNTETSSSTM